MSERENKKYSGLTTKELQKRRKTLIAVFIGFLIITGLLGFGALYLVAAEDNSTSFIFALSAAFLPIVGIIYYFMKAIPIEKELKWRKKHNPQDKDS